MNNFVFSQSIELSILEHRLLTLFEMLEKIQENHFFPALLFNESFWQLQYEKRLAILSSSQVDWVGDLPNNRSYLFKDPYFLNLLKSIKLTYFSYSKIDLKGLIDILSIKNKFAITDFSSFGDETNSPLLALNKIISSIPDKEESKEKYLYAVNILAKVSTIKFYARFQHQKKITCLIVNPTGILEYWENFFSSLKLIDETQKSNLLQKTSFYFYETSEEGLKSLEVELRKYPNLTQLYEEKKLTTSVLDLFSFEKESKFDYIYLNTVLNTVPAEILIKYNRGYYNVLGRLAYTNRGDEAAAEETVTKLQSKDPGQIKKEDLQSIDYEVLFKPYTNQRVIEILEQNYSIRERQLIRFSPNILAILVHLIKSLKKGGFVEIWDYTETRSSRNSLALMRRENGEVYTLIDFDLYTCILNSFDDISINHSIKSLYEVVSEEVKDNKAISIKFEQFLGYLNFDPTFWKEFFNINNLDDKAEIERIIKSLKFFEYLKKRTIYLFGLPTLMYGLGFRKLKNTLLKHPKLKEYILEDNLVNSNLGSYEDEIISSLIPLVYQKVNEIKGVPIKGDKDSPENADFYKLLKKVGFNKEKVMEIISKRWDELVGYSLFISNVKQLEITKMSKNS